MPLLTKRFGEAVLGGCRNIFLGICKALWDYTHQGHVYLHKFPKEMA